MIAKEGFVEGVPNFSERAYRRQLLPLYNGYLEQFPEEDERLRLFREALLNFDVQLHSRKEMRGHVTSGVLIMHPVNETLLLVRHNATGLLTAPGGHFDISDFSLWNTAAREAFEETGLIVEQTGRVPWDYLPIDIDTHPIGARPEKGEGPHNHFDLRFVGYPSTLATTIALKEIAGAEWTSLDKMTAENGLAPSLLGIPAKLQKIGLVSA